ncbi:MAG: hypothetical protein AAF634_15490 [Bacteroidota bacterium]
MESPIDNRLILKFEKMLQLHHQIKKRTSGSAAAIASYLGVSETEVYYLIQQLMELNPSLRYHHEKRTYYYGDGFPDHVAISIAVIRGKDAIQKLINVTTTEPVTYTFLFT